MFGTKDLQLPNLTTNCIPRELVRYSNPFAIFSAEGAWLRQTIYLWVPKGGGHSHRSCTSTRDQGQNVGQVVKAENLSSQRVKVNFSRPRWSKLVQRSTSGGCGLISFEVGQGSRPTFRCGQEVKA